MTWRTQINEKGVVTRYCDTDSGETISAKEYERRMQMQQGSYSGGAPMPGMYAVPPPPPGAYAAPGAYAPPGSYSAGPLYPANSGAPTPGQLPVYAPVPGQQGMMPGMQSGLSAAPPSPVGAADGANPLIQPGAQMVGAEAQGQIAAAQPSSTGGPQSVGTFQGQPPTAGMAKQGKNLRLEGNPQHLANAGPIAYRPHGFLDATSIAILLPTLVLLALIIAAAHKKRLFPWQTVRTFNPPSGLMTPREYERSFLCPPNLRRHGRIGKRNPNATWTDADGVVLPFGFLARTHLPVTIPIGRMPNKNMFIVAPTGSGKTTLMRAIIKALLAKPCVIIALEAKANDPNLDEMREGFKYTVLPEAQQAGFETLYFNPLDNEESIHWNPLDLSPIVFASSIVQDINALEPEEQHWAERDHGYISGLAQLLKWGAVQVTGEDENGVAAQVNILPCNPRGLMRLVNNRRNIVESLRRLKNNPEVDPGELSELTQTLSSIIRTDTDWDKNIQGVRGRLRMFKNPSILRVTEHSNVDLRASMHKPTVLIFGAPASLGPDAESLASCFVYQLQQALHTRYGTVSVLPLFAFFDEYQTLNMDIAGRLSAIVRGANGGLTIMLQNVSQIARSTGSADPANSGSSELKTIFSNAAVRVCLHNADETTARFFSEEIGKHAVVVPGVADHFQAGGFGIFPSSWNRIHSQQVVARVDPDAIKRMEKHHALVYLSPAGDPQFGETKPFMVDLRGIEEIARLHLLHYVASRRTPPGAGGPETGDGGSGSPEHGGFGSGGGAHDAAHSPGAGPVAARAQTGSFAVPPSAQSRMPTFAQVTGDQSQQSASTSSTTQARACPACGQAAGNRKFCIQCGYFLGPSAGSNSEPQVELKTSAVVLSEKPAGQFGSPYSQPASPVSTPVKEPVAQASLPESPASSGPPFPFARVNPPMTMSDVDEIVTNSAASRKTPFFDDPLQIADAVKQQTFGMQREPVRSLNPDLAKLGLPQPDSTTQKNADEESGPSRSRSRGIEF